MQGSLSLPRAVREWTVACGTGRSRYAALTGHSGGPLTVMDSRWRRVSNGMGLHPQLEFPGWDRPADLVSLHQVATHVGQLALGKAILDAVRDDGHSEVVPQVDGGAHDYGAVGVVR